MDILGNGCAVIFTCQGYPDDKAISRGLLWWAGCESRYVLVKENISLVSCQRLIAERGVAQTHRVENSPDGRKSETDDHSTEDGTLPFIGVAQAIGA